MASLAPTSSKIKNIHGSFSGKDSSFLLRVIVALALGLGYNVSILHEGKPGDAGDETTPTPPRRPIAVHPARFHPHHQTNAQVAKG